MQGTELLVHRAVKFGLYGLVLAGLVGGTAAWTLVDKTVHVQVDGQAKTVHTMASTVSGALKDGGLPVGEHDFVAPATQSTVHDGSRVVLRHGRQLMLDVDGTRRVVWTTADTVDDALGDLGYSTQDYTSVSRDQRLPLSLTAITLRTPKLVTVKHDGQTQTVTTTDSTVGQVLADLRVVAKPTDRLTPAATAPVTSRMTVVLGRVTRKNVTQQTQIPFPTQKQNLASLPTGQTQIVQAGKNGVIATTYQIVYVDGKAVGKAVLSKKTVSAPQAQVIGVGTGATPSSAPTSSGPTSSGPTSSAPPAADAAAAPAVSVTPGSAQAIAESMLPQFGWGDDQMSCLIQMWDHESGWRVEANNAGSGAYGIPQALPGSKMAVYGSDWQTNARTQITWGLHYIQDRYNSPCQAWSTWQANGGWY